MDLTVLACGESQRGAGVRVAAEAFDLGGQAGRIGGQPVLGEHHGGSVVAQPRDVVALVVVARAGPRDEDRRHTRDGDLVHRARAAASDEEVGGGVHPRHVGLVPEHGVVDRTLDRSDPVDESLAGDLADSELGVVGTVGAVVGDRVVEETRSERAAHDHHEEPVLVDSEARPGGRTAHGRTIDVEHRPTHRCAGELGAREVGCVERDRTGGSPPRRDTTRPSGSPVVGHDHHGYVEPTSGQHGRK